MQQPPVPATLIHHTESDSSLLSIVRFGFLAVAYPTGLLDVIAAGRLLPEEAIASGGMICFSEPNETNSAALREEFGRCGIAVAGDAFRNHPIRKVTYLNPNGPSVGRLRRAFVRFAPANLPVIPAPCGPPIAGLRSDDDIGPALRSAMVVTALGMPGLDPRDPFVRLMSKLKYCQTSFHRQEREWRLTGPVISWMPTTPTGIGDARRERKKQELQVLRASYKRSEQAGQISADDRELLGRLSFCPEPRNIRWLEVPGPKVESVRRKLKVLRNVWGRDCGGIEVRGV
jgi:hypothetical protein